VRGAIAAIGLEPSGGYERDSRLDLAGSRLLGARINPNKLRQFGRAAGALAEMTASLVAELAAHRDRLGKGFDGWVSLNHSRGHDRDITGDQARIDVGLYPGAAPLRDTLQQRVVL
jgi:hypothetical protein